jgi:hypothetical protein
MQFTTQPKGKEPNPEARPNQYPIRLLGWLEWGAPAGKPALVLVLVY